MNINLNIRLISDQSDLPTRKFWGALRAVFNYYLLEELGQLRAKRVPQRVADAVRFLDCWLDQAIERDWCEYETSED